MKKSLRRIFKSLSLLVVIILISAFPVFMSPVKGIGNMDKEDYKKIAEQIRVGSERESPD